MPRLENIVFRILRLFGRLPLNRIMSFGASTRIFADYFKDFDKVDAVRGIFGERTEEVLHNLKVELTWFGGYMFVNSSNGHLVINARYLNSGDKVDIYLDLIHELCHIKQFMEGKELFDSHYDYVDRPTEVEAYRYTVQEARRIGLSNERICQYLKTEWMSDEDLKRLAKAVNVTC
ncbi:hypothetical protein MUO79_04770 [Candidatus Bathyarchaeota archaeon]|nr:hypothetical protein [Candidatus Bathyarchaeota archaeon]